MYKSKQMLTKSPSPVLMKKVSGVTANLMEGTTPYNG